MDLRAQLVMMVAALIAAGMNKTAPLLELDDPNPGASACHDAVDRVVATAISMRARARSSLHQD